MAKDLSPASSYFFALVGMPKEAGNDIRRQNKPPFLLRVYPVV